MKLAKFFQLINWLGIEPSEYEDFELVTPDGLPIQSIHFEEHGDKTVYLSDQKESQPYL
jgi:hypothetical protein